MKEHPILFSAPMVRAILAGTKTQTRRAVKPQPDDLWPDGAECYSDARGPFRVRPSDVRVQLGVDGLTYDAGCQFAGPIACPYGYSGDRLWVREAFDPIYGQSPPDRIIEVDYRASWEPHGKHWRMKDAMGTRRWKPSIHMPRSISRITLEIVSVRVEQLHEISEADALAEGVFKKTGTSPIGDCVETSDGRGEMIYALPGMARTEFRHLWESINSSGSWDANPFVWVVEFKRVQS